MQEIWKPVAGYEGIYEVSNFGRVKSVARTIDHNGFMRFRKERILTPIKRNRQGYMSVNLYSGKHKFTMCSIHRLVGVAFLPNPDNLPYINHKDENPSNNRVDNLEWCTQKYNTNYGTCPARIARALSKPIIQKTMDGEPIRVWKSCADAGRSFGARAAHICQAAKGERPHAYGYKWEYNLISE
jgi:hypothetical protein